MAAMGSNPGSRLCSVEGPTPVLEQRPGRTCPVSYRYSPRVFDRAADLVAETLYVVGGLYGNVEALAAVQSLAAQEPGGATIVFNGDFHWFDVVPADFAAIEAGVAAHAAIRGNVETEIAGDDSGAGCGCAYPLDVTDAVVTRSNQILDRLRETAHDHPIARERLGRLPMHRVAQVGDSRVGIVHGDATSLAGWGFDRQRLADPAHRRWVESMFAQARVDVFASTHTCMPALARFDGGVVANNGAAGMPNFSGERAGLLTRIALCPIDSPVASEQRIGDVHVQIVPIAYDHERWLARFLAAWPEGSPAHASYYSRILEGPLAA
jgi:hypothetical protein